MFAFVNMLIFIWSLKDNRNYNLSLVQIIGKHFTKLYSIQWKTIPTHKAHFDGLLLKTGQRMPQSHNEAVSRVNGVKNGRFRSILAQVRCRIIS